MSVRVCRPILFKNLCLVLVSGVLPLFRTTRLECVWAGERPRVSGDDGRHADARRRLLATLEARVGATPARHGAVTSPRLGVATPARHGAMTSSRHGAVTSPRRGAVTSPRHGAVTSPRRGAATSSRHGAARSCPPARARHGHDEQTDNTRRTTGPRPATRSTAVSTPAERHGHQVCVVAVSSQPHQKPSSPLRFMLDCMHAGL